MLMCYFSDYHRLYVYTALFLVNNNVWIFYNIQLFVIMPVVEKHTYMHEIGEVTPVQVHARCFLACQLI